ncbi:hypothetical protein [Catenovulum sediminis]|uniref:hypothetical protein n=1 Tax=Catenovulum sediminis TaxID=1740262 RepID=UPI00163D52F2|nr:hypothetical protein [Catenovulum sediminis]
MNYKNKKQQLIKQVLVILSHHLAQKPKEQLSIRQLAQMVGCVPSAIVKTFGSYGKCWQMYAKVNFCELTELLESSQSTEDFLNICFNYAATKPYCWQLLFESDVNIALHLVDYAAQRQLQIIHLLAEKITTEFTCDSKLAHQRAKTLWLACFGLLHLQAQNRMLVWDNEQQQFSRIYKSIMDEFSNPAVIK